MPNERRAAQRYTINRTARLDWDHRVACDCLLVDLSDTGARIHVERNDVPEEFALTIFSAENIRIHCRAMWRLGFEIGVRFADARPGLTAKIAAIASASSRDRAHFGLRGALAGPRRRAG